MKLSFLLTSFRLATATVFFGMPGAFSFAAEQSEAPTFTSEAQGNIFTDINGAMTLHLPTSIVGGEIVARNEFGNVVSTFSLPEEANEKFSFSLPGKGYYSLTAELKLVDGSSTRAETTSTVVGPLIPDALRMQSRLGLWTVQGDPELVLAAGARWNRRMISIHTVGEELLDAEPPEAERELFHDSPFTQVGVMSFGLPLWLMEPTEKKKSFGNPLTKPKDWGQLKELVSAWVRQHEKHFPDYFEIYNEPEWQWAGGTNAELVRVLATIADGIKEVRPQTKVLGPGFSSIRIQDSARLDLVTANEEGLFDHLDGLVVHAYVDGSAPEEEFIQRVIELQEFLREIDRPDFPIHLTEFGWTSGKGTWQKPVDELTQARYAVRSLTLLAALGVENATFFCLHYKAAPNPGERGFSLIRDDSTPKPSFAAYANVARWLAGVRGLGNWLRLTPTTHLILFEKTDDTSVAVAWDTETTRTIGLPLVTSRREDMMGRPLDADADELEVSPSPIFLEFSSAQSPEIKMLPALDVMRGGDDTVLSGSDAWIAPAPLKVRNGRLAVPATAQNGDYLLLTEADGEWIGQPIRVIPPLQATEPVLEWPTEVNAPRLTTTVTSHADGPVTTRVAVALEDTRDRFLNPPVIHPGDIRRLSVPLEGLAPGKRYRGQLAVDTRHEGRRDVVTRPLDLTLLAASPVAHGSEPDWERIPSIDFTDWDPFGGPIAREDCSATLQAAHGAEGLYLRVAVRDDDHLQNRSGEEIWSQDAIQIGLDPDFEKSWEANDLFGLKGHRVFEYGVAWDGTDVMTWRWISYVPELPVGEPEPRIDLRVDRVDDLTIYNILFPWSTLGLDKPMAAGSAMGISLSLADADAGKKGRRALRLFGGIAEGKDPEKYGPLWLR
ncbi:sugar-binding protein [Coraliomargarita algicola]|uniref:Sugar-binding protein n=1 Tax=Coraliomargarita algicola TaxID=3092156 RepID=A0ABZ0RIV6_9BACT|nr:sugar-binding protein [Coraliomargarita sp. J2-16]WPJ95106.1 sugar-binding protein [Coraliomargarita sp. J2-16]